MYILVVVKFQKQYISVHKYSTLKKNFVADMKQSTSALFESLSIINFCLYLRQPVNIISFNNLQKMLMLFWNLFFTSHFQYTTKINNTKKYFIQTIVSHLKYPSAKAKVFTHRPFYHPVMNPQIINHSQQQAINFIYHNSQ